jgi:hypothetical protein
VIVFCVLGVSKKGREEEGRDERRREEGRKEWREITCVLLTIQDMFLSWIEEKIRVVTGSSNTTFADLQRLKQRNPSIKGNF